MGVVLRQVALIALITEAPELARMVAVIEEELRKGLDAAKGIAAGRERAVVVAVEEDDRHVLDATDVGAKADRRLAEIEVLDHREVGGKGRADLRALVRRSGARRACGAKLQHSGGDGGEAKMSGGHCLLPVGSSPNDRELADSRVTATQVLPTPANGAALSAQPTQPRWVDRCETGSLENLFLVFGQQLFPTPVTHHIRDCGRVSLTRCNPVAFGGYSSAPFTR